ncbi:hypothetical protein INT45_004422 [Circinella minor]|uniref:Uncharacterized protein n=1 Tax=Circinella minor TaxID=1195481 RepID=A0A8H7V8P1_9FUNG|nr:hypothetical protein INT45_004422 [Circinella minor]
MVFEPLRYTRSGVTGRFVPLGGAEEDGILADGLVERRQGSVCSYYGWWNGEGVPTSVASLWLVTVGVGKGGSRVWDTDGTLGLVRFLA